MNHARRDLCGGCAEMRIPTAIVLIKIGRQTLSTLASTLIDLCFLVTDLCFLTAKISENRPLPWHGRGIGQNSKI